MQKFSLGGKQARLDRLGAVVGTIANDLVQPGETELLADRIARFHQTIGEQDDNVARIQGDSAHAIGYIWCDS